MEIQLSPEQREIVKATKGAHLVLASAGSGKTRVLTEWVKRLLSSQKRRYRVLALTFTNRAAEEMRERLKDIPDLNERAFVGTMHAFCQMVLEAHYSALGEGERMPTIFERDEDRMVLMEKALHGIPAISHRFKTKNPKERLAILMSLLAALSGAKRSFAVGLPEVTEPVCREYADAIREGFEAELYAQQGIDFDDLLVLTHRLFTEQSHILEHYTSIYRYICVDEAQDLNAIHYELIRLLGQPNRNVLLVGCKSQAIYGFNGASIEYMEQAFCADFEPVRRHELLKNYRSAQSVIRAANPLAASSDDRMSPDEAAYEGECAVIACEDEQQEAKWVLAKISSLLISPPRDDIEGEMTYGKMAVLARNRYAMHALEKALKSASIPYELRQQQNGLSFDSDLMQVFDLGLCLLVNPRSHLHLNQLRKQIGMEDPVSNVSAAKGIDLLESLRESVNNDWSERFEFCLQEWRNVAADATKLFPVLKRFEQYAQQASAWDEHERARALADVDLMRECWTRYTHNTSSEVRSLAGFRAKLSLGVVRPSGDDNVLTLATVHSVKGLEFDVVFLIGMVEGVFPDYRAHPGTRQMREEQNNAFVAMTRARRVLYMTYPRSKLMPWGDRKSQQKSRFLPINKLYLAADGDRPVLRVAESRGDQINEKETGITLA